MFIQRWTRMVGLAALLIVAWPAQAQLCVVAAVAPIFQPYQGTERTGVGSITVTCTGTLATSLPYSIQLQSSASTLGTQRRMKGLLTGTYLDYNYHCDTSYGAPWFNGTGSCQVTGTFPLVKIHSVYGRIPPGQNPMPDTYNDSTPVLVLY